MIHQPSGGARGQATDIEIQARRILQMKDRLNQILAANTGQPLSKIKEDVERDYFMEAEQARNMAWWTIFWYRFLKTEKKSKQSLNQFDD